MMRGLLTIQETGDIEKQPMVSRRWGDTARLLRERGIDLRIATLRSRSVANQALERLGIETIALGIDNPIQFPVGLRRLKAYVNANRIQVVQGDEVIPAIVCGSAIRDRSRCSVLFFREHTATSRRLNAASKLAARLCDATMVGSRAVAECAVGLDGTPTSRVHVVGMGTMPPPDPDPLAVAELRRGLGIAADDLLILVVSRLRYEKGIDVLLEAFGRAFSARDSGVHLVIVGNGPEESTLRSLARSVHSPVHFLGFHLDVAAFYAAADVVVMPSRREAFPLVACEAMSHGKPLLASEVGGFPEIVSHGRDGWLVPSQDIAAWTAALKKLASSRAEIEAAGRAARETFEERLHLSHVVDRWVRTWQFVRSGARRSDLSSESQ